MRRAMPGHRVAHLRQLVGAGDGRLRRGVLVDGGVGQARTVAPDAVQQVQAGIDVDALGGQRGAQLLRQPQAEHLAVDGQRLARLQLVGDPADVVRGRAGGNLEQRDPAARQFTLGLCPVAAVGEELRIVQRHHQRRHRPGETRQHFTTLPAARQILRQMRVGRGHQDGMGTGVAQGVAQVG